LSSLGDLSEGFVAFLEGEGPSKRRSSRSSVALPPLFSTGVSGREGERPIEGGVRGTRTGRPYNSGLDPEAIEPFEDPEGPNSSRIGS
jgi:hypothetical protein